MNIYDEIEELQAQNKIHYLNYKKTGLLVLYPFLILLTTTIIALIFIRRDVVIELTGVISNSESGIVVPVKVTSQVEAIYVTRLQHVNYGDVLMRLDTDSITRSIELQSNEINILEDKLMYLDYYEKSIIYGENIMPSNQFGYYFRVENHLRDISNLSEEIDLSTVEHHSGRNQITTRITQVENLIRDYENFLRIVDGDQNYSITDRVVRTKADDFKANLEMFDYYTRRERETYEYERIYLPILEDSLYDEDYEQKYEYVRVINTEYYYEKDEAIYNQLNLFIINNRLNIQQILSTYRNELRTLNNELSAINRNIERDQGSLDRNSLTASERILLEIFELKEVVQNQLTIYERELSSLLERYDEHTITAPATGNFHLSDHITLGNIVNSHSEIGRIIDGETEGSYIISFVNTTDINRFNVGQATRFTLIDGDNNRYPVSGTLDIIGHMPIQTEVGNMFMIQSLVDTDFGHVNLHYGMTGTLNVITGRTTILRYWINRLF